METIKIRIPLNVTRPVTEEMAVEQLNAAIIKLIKVGALKGNPSDFILGYDIKNYDAENCVVVEINKEALADVAPFQTVGGGLSLDDQKFHWWDNRIELPKTFSAATIKERLRLKGRGARVQLKYLVLDYKRYWNANKAKISEADQKQLIQLFVNDLMQLFNQIIPSIKEGKQLQNLLGLSTISPNLNKVAQQLSMAYRLALKSEETSGAPQKNRYITLKNKYLEFLKALIPVVFEGINLGEEKSKEETKQNSYSYTKDGRIDLFSNGDKAVRMKNLAQEHELDEKKINKRFEELKKSGKLARMTFDEIFDDVMRNTED